MNIEKDKLEEHKSCIAFGIMKRVFFVNLLSQDCQKNTPSETAEECVNYSRKLLAELIGTCEASGCKQAFNCTAFAKEAAEQMIISAKGLKYKPEDFPSDTTEGKRVFAVKDGKITQIQ